MNITAFISHLFRAPLHPYFKALLLQCLMGSSSAVGGDIPTLSVCPNDDELLALDALTALFSSVCNVGCRCRSVLYRDPVMIMVVVVFAWFVVQLPSLRDLRKAAHDRFTKDVLGGRPPVQHDDRLCVFGSGADALTRRKDGYAVRLIGIDDAVTVAAEHKIEVHVLDFSQQSTGLDDSTVFNRVRGVFEERQCCFVAVKGLKRMSVTLVKWIAEYTKANPWVVVFIDEVTEIVNMVAELESRCGCL